MKLLLRVIRVIRGWLNLGVSTMENKSVDALVADLEASKDTAVNKIVTKTAALKAQIYDMEKDLTKHEADESKYERATKKALSQNNEELAKDLAQKYSEEHAQCETLRAGVKNARGLYEKLVAEQNHVIESYTSRISQLKAAATSANVKEQLASMSAAADFGPDNSFERTLSDVEKIVSHKDSVETAKLDVQDDIKVTDMNNEAEKILRDDSRDEALARFKSEMNIEN